MDVTEDWAAIKSALGSVIYTDPAMPWTPGLEKKYKAPPKGWSAWAGSGWESFDPDDLPLCMVLDLECSQARDGQWLAVLGMAWSAGRWYCWTGRDAEIPFPAGRLLVMQDGTRHDLAFLSCTYSHPGKTLVLDSHTMAAAMNGIPPECIEIFQAFSGLAMAGKSSHPWASHCTKLDLASLAAYYLGKKISKDLQEQHKNTPYAAIWDHTEPRTLIGYCAQDVIYTAQIAAQLVQILAGRYFPMAQSMVGMVRLSTASALINIGRAINIVESEIAGVERQLRGIVSELAGCMMLAYKAEGYEIPRSDLDWRELKGGKDKGKLRWFRDLEKASYSHDSIIAIQMADLRYKMQFVEWNGSKFQADGEEIGRFPITVENVENNVILSANPFLEDDRLILWAEARERLGRLRHTRFLLKETHSVGGVAKLPARPGDVCHLPSCPLLPWVLEQQRKGAGLLQIPEGFALVSEGLGEDDLGRGHAGDIGSTRTELNKVLPPDGLAEPEGLKLHDSWAQWLKGADLGDRIHNYVAARPGERLIGVDDGKIFYLEPLNE